MDYVVWLGVGLVLALGALALGSGRGFPIMTIVLAMAASLIGGWFFSALAYEPIYSGRVTWNGLLGALLAGVAMLILQPLVRRRSLPPPQT